MILFYYQIRGLKYRKFGAFFQSDTINKWPKQYLHLAVWALHRWIHWISNVVYFFLKKILWYLMLCSYFQTCPPWLIYLYKLKHNILNLKWTPQNQEIPVSVLSTYLMFGIQPLNIHSVIALYMLCVCACVCVCVCWGRDSKRVREQCYTDVCVNTIKKVFPPPALTLQTCGHVTQAHKMWTLYLHVCKVFTGNSLWW